MDHARSCAAGGAAALAADENALARGLRGRFADALAALADRLRPQTADACEKCGADEGRGACGLCGSYSCPYGCRSPAESLDAEEERCRECGAGRDWTWYGGGPLGPKGGPA